jgi:hypothetical protein
MLHEQLDSGEQLFWRAFPTIKCIEIAYARVEAFQKLYCFCRNMAFVALLSVPALIGKATAAALWGGSQAWRQPTGWAFVMLVAGIGMSLRYLKFRRLYVVEVLTSFAETLRPSLAPSSGSGLTMTVMASDGGNAARPDPSGHGAPPDRD